MLDAIFIQFVLTICFMLMTLVIVPSPVALKKLTGVCEKYSIEDEIIIIHCLKSNIQEAHIMLPRLFVCTFGQSICTILAHLSDFCMTLG